MRRAPRPTRGDRRSRRAIPTRTARLESGADDSDAGGVTWSPPPGSTSGGRGASGGRADAAGASSRTRAAGGGGPAFGLLGGRSRSTTRLATTRPAARNRSGKGSSSRKATSRAPPIEPSMASTRNRATLPSSVTITRARARGVLRSDPSVHPPAPPAAPSQLETSASRSSALGCGLATSSMTMGAAMMQRALEARGPSNAFRASISRHAVRTCTEISTKPCLLRARPVTPLSCPDAQCPSAGGP